MEEWRKRWAGYAWIVFLEKKQQVRAEYRRKGEGAFFDPGR